MKLRRSGTDHDIAARLTRILDPGVADHDEWVESRPVAPRSEADKLRGWVPDRPEARVKRKSVVPEKVVPEKEMDDLDRFLASQGLDGLGDVDDWNVDDDARGSVGWWSRLTVPWRAAVAIVVLGALAVAVAGIRSVTADRPGTVTSVPLRTAAPAPGVVGETTAPASAGAATPTSTARSGTVYVHVAGQVRRPGVVKLPASSRVMDAVKAAGGLTSKADVDRVNLARVVQDGEQIRVPAPGEEAPVPDQPAAADTGSGGTGAAKGAMVNLNTAGLGDLEGLDGVGPVLAQRILDYRTAHGSFRAIDELSDVTGIGDKLMARIRPQVTV